MRALFALILAASASPAVAVDVFKCIGASGEVVFSNTPCPGASKPHSTYSAAPARPAYEQGVESAEPVEQFEAAEPARATMASAEPQAVAYYCQASRVSWVATTGCPPTLRHLRSESISGTNVVTGQPIRGTTTSHEYEPVRETPLSRDDLCSLLRSGPAMSSGPQSSSDASYQRNKLRQQYGC